MSGATVAVYALGNPPREVARDSVSSGDVRIPLVAGSALNANEVLVAIQDFNGEQSEFPTGDLGAQVQPAPQSLPMVGFDSHQYECGRYVRISGLLPGAGVEVSCAGFSLGSAVALEGYTTVSLGTPFPVGLNVTAYQTAPGLAPGPAANRTVDKLPIPQGQYLPPPVVVPPRGCDASIHVSGVFDGSLVTIERGDGQHETAGCGEGMTNVVLTRPVDEGESLRIKQDVEKQCERPGDWSDRIVAGPIEPINEPIIVGPLCAGASMVTILGLRPGAIVHISFGRGTDTEDGWVFTVESVYHGQAPPTVTEWTFRLPPLAEGSIFATQELCGIVSPSSQMVDVYPRQDNFQPALIKGPLFECARNVSVSHVRPITARYLETMKR